MGRWSGPSERTTSMTRFCVGESFGGSPGAVSAGRSTSVRVTIPTCRFTAAGVTADSYWRPFEPATIAELVREGKIVFVDVTADWCLTCKVNKSLVLDRGDIAGWLAGDQVVAIRADWTRPDDRIARYLESFGRYGIPFNAVYGPAAPNGVALPELLTVEAVQAAVRQAGGEVATAQR